MVNRQLENQSLRSSHGVESNWVGVIAAGHSPEVIQGNFLQLWKRVPIVHLHKHTNVQTTVRPLKCCSTHKS